MGLLRDLQTRNGTVAYLNGVDAAIHDPDRDVFEERLWELWKIERAQKEQTMQLLRVELTERSNRSSAGGRPRALQAYKTYQKGFIRRWAQTVSANAKEKGFTQTHLVEQLFKHDEKQLISEESGWRALLRGDSTRMKYDTLCKCVSISAKAGLYASGDGKLRWLFSRPPAYMSEKNFICQFGDFGFDATN